MVLKFMLQKQKVVPFTATSSLYTNALYHGDDTADDTGNGNTLTLNGTATAGDTGGKFGDCFDFPGGSGNYISAASSADFDLSNNDYVIDFWYNQASDMGSGQYTYFQIGSDDTNAIRAYVDNKRMYCLIRSGGSTVVPISTTDSIGDWNPATGWRHMAVVHSGTDYHLFDNGTRRNTVSDADGMPSGNRPLNLGYYPGAGYEYTGNIDEFRVYVGDDYGWTGTTITTPDSQYKVV